MAFNWCEQSNISYGSNFRKIKDEIATMKSEVGLMYDNFFVQIYLKCMKYENSWWKLVHGHCDDITYNSEVSVKHLSLCNISIQTEINVLFLLIMQTFYLRTFSIHHLAFNSFSSHKSFAPYYIFKVTELRYCLIMGFI